MVTLITHVTVDSKCGKDMLISGVTCWLSARRSHGPSPFSLYSICRKQLHDNLSLVTLLFATIRLYYGFSCGQLDFLLFSTIQLEFSGALVTLLLTRFWFAMC